VDLIPSLFEETLMCVGTGNCVALITDDLSGEALLLKSDSSHEIPTSGFSDDFTKFNDNGILPCRTRQYIDANTSPLERWLRDPAYTPGWREMTEDGLENNAGILVKDIYTSTQWNPILIVN
jgi:hypothetical protein